MSSFSDLLTRNRRVLKKVLNIGGHFVPRISSPVILMYHRIAEAETDPWALAVPPSLLDEQLEALARHRLVLPLTELGRLHFLGKLPGNAVAITFDDGYACNALAAAPLLERHRLPATVFLTTGAVSSEEEFWWDALERLVQTTDAETLNFAIGGKSEDIVLGERTRGDSEYCWRTSDGPKTARQAAYLKIWDILRLAPDHERRRAIGTLATQASVSRLARQSYRPLDVPEVQRIAKTGLLEIGAHSVTHPVLSRLSREEVITEINQSRDDCQKLVGYVPKAFAYPYGEYDEQTISAVADAGFDVACTTVSAAVGRRARCLELPRLHVLAWNSKQLFAAMERLRGWP